MLKIGDESAHDSFVVYLVADDFIPRFSPESRERDSNSHEIFPQRKWWWKADGKLKWENSQMSTENERKGDSSFNPMQILFIPVIKVVWRFGIGRVGRNKKTV